MRWWVFDGGVDSVKPGLLLIVHAFVTMALIRTFIKMGVLFTLSHERGLVRQASMKGTEATRVKSIRHRKPEGRGGENHHRD